MIKNIVISGGGTKGICFLGALSLLDEKKLLSNVNTYIGTSVGAIISTLLAIGYTPDNIMQFIISFDFKKLEPDFDIDILLEKYGIDNGEKLCYVIKNLIKEKTGNENITFKDLYEKYNKKLYITASCISDNKPYYYNNDNHPDMIIWEALRKSFSVPCYFQPVIEIKEYYIDEKLVQEEKIYVDGGVIDNYPIQLVDPKETIGITVIDKDFDNDYKINNIYEYCLSMIKCCINNNIEQKIKKYIDNTIIINTSNYDMLDFEMTNDLKIDMFFYGIECGYKFLQENESSSGLSDNNLDSSSINLSKIPNCP